jgi:hypothetical protein
MLRAFSAPIRSAIFVAMAAACAADPGAGLSFRDMQAEQAAIQSALAGGETGVPQTWRGPDGGHGSVALVGAPDGDGCRRIEATNPVGMVSDTWCPTPHGFWVHPDELFYRNATGRETYGGTVRSGGPDPQDRAPPGDARPDQIDCLKLLSEERRLSRDGREAAARAERRAYHRCLQQAR